MWIAFKIYYLRDTTQHLLKLRYIFSSCELLSKFIIFVTRHNNLFLSLNILNVVNCFQNLLSSWHDTTICVSVSSGFSLWIAFKIYYLRDTTQQLDFVPAFRVGCELLSKFIIFVTRHNVAIMLPSALAVVNCFQNLLSSWHDTTVLSLCHQLGWLWIAFKIYYLRDTTQRNSTKTLVLMCCELLSKFIIFVTRHNWNIFILGKQPVVNCFQNLLSSWHDTTFFCF